MTEKESPLAPAGLPAAAEKQLLKARALELARPPVRQQGADETLSVIEFRLAHERYAIEETYAREVQTLRDLTPLPCTPAFILGMINIRGQILPVLDIKKFFSLPDSGITDLHAVIVVHAGDIELGILADAIVGVRSILLSSIQPPLPTLTGVGARYLRGVTEDHVVILNVLEILEDPKIRVDEEVSKM